MPGLIAENSDPKNATQNSKEYIREYIERGKWTMRKKRYERHEREVGQWDDGAPGSRSLHASIALVLRVDLACWQGCSFLGKKPRSASWSYRHE